MKTKLITILISLAGVLTIIFVLHDILGVLENAFAQEKVDTIVISISLVIFLGALFLGGIFIIISAFLEASQILVTDDLITVRYDFFPSISFSSNVDFKQFTIWNFAADANTERHVRASLFVNLPYLFVVTEKTEGNFHAKWELPFEYTKE